MFNPLTIWVNGYSMLNKLFPLLYLLLDICETRITTFDFFWVWFGTLPKGGTIWSLAQTPYKIWQTSLLSKIIVCTICNYLHFQLTNFLKNASFSSYGKITYFVLLRSLCPYLTYNFLTAWARVTVFALCVYEYVSLSLLTVSMYFVISSKSTMISTPTKLNSKMPNVKY